MTNPLQNIASAYQIIQAWCIDSTFKRQVVKESIQSFNAWTWKYEIRVIIPEPKVDEITCHASQ